MAASSSNSWIPAAGSYEVTLGLNLRNALKARKGSPKENRKFPKREVYSIRYNFIPESVDATKPGTIEAKKQEGTRVTVERAQVASSQSREQNNKEWNHRFSGTESAAKEVDCVLIYEEGGFYTLERLDSFINLTYDKRVERKPKHTGSPLPPSRPSTSTSSSSTNVPLAQSQTRKQTHDVSDDLEAELGEMLGSELDAAGDPDDEFAELVPDTPPKPAAKREAPLKTKASAKGKVRATVGAAAHMPTPAPARPQSAVRKEEEEEGSEGEIMEPTRQIPAPTPTPAPTPALPKAKAKPVQRSTDIAKAAAAIREKKAKANAATTSAPAPAPAPTSASHRLPVKPSAAAPVKKVANPKKRERELPAEETFNISRISQPSQPKRARRSPSPKPKPKEVEEFTLELPDAGGPVVTLPPAPLPPPVPAPAPSTAAALSALPDESDDDDDDDEEWDDVMPAASPAPPPPPPPIMSPPVRRIVMEEIEPELGPSRPLYPEPEVEEEEEEIDLDELAAEMDQHLGDDMDDEEDMEPVVSPIEATRPRGLPMSMSDYALQEGGEGEGDSNLWGDEDSDEDSDDSDED